jgi:CheY-like chemotaxis protein
MAFAAGCDGYLTKPIDFAELYELLEHLLPAASNAKSAPV